MDVSNYKHNYEYLSYGEAEAIADGTFVKDVTSIVGELVTKYDINTILSSKGKHMTSIVAGDGSEYVCYYECADDTVITNTETVYKYSYDGTTWSTGSPYLVWAADDVTPKDVYLSIVRNEYDQNGQLVSSTNLDADGYTLNDGNLFTATISGNKATVAPKAVNESYTAVKAERLTAYAAQYSITINCTQEKKGVVLVDGDVIIFEFGWDKGTDLDSAVYLPQLSTNMFAGFGGSAATDNGRGDYLIFAGDNTGTGKEHTAVDFRAVKKYIENEDLISSILDEDGQPCVTVDIYNVWYKVKGTEQISLDYSAYTYTGDSCSIKRISGEYDFEITGLEKKETSQQSALTYAYGNKLHEDPAYWYTQTARFKYYLGSGVFSIETNYDNVSKWGKGFDQDEIAQEITRNIDYSETFDGNTLAVTINTSCSDSSSSEYYIEFAIICDSEKVNTFYYNYKALSNSNPSWSQSISMNSVINYLKNLSIYDKENTYYLQASAYAYKYSELDKTYNRYYYADPISATGDKHEIIT